MGKMTFPGKRGVPWFRSFEVAGVLHPASVGEIDAVAGTMP